MISPRQLANKEWEMEADSRQLVNCTDWLSHNVAAWDWIAGRINSTFPLEELDLTSWCYSSSRILDYGCGTGRLMIELNRLGIKNVIGMDTSSNMCKIARTRMPGAIVTWISNPRVPKFSDLMFDTVILVGVLSSVVPVNERKALVMQLRDAIWPGGKILIADFGRSDEPIYRNRYRLPTFEKYTFKTEEDLFIHHFECEEIIDLLGSGFNTRETRRISTMTIHGNLLPGHIVLADRS